MDIDIAKDLCEEDELDRGLLDADAGAFGIDDDCLVNRISDSERGFRDIPQRWKAIELQVLEVVIFTNCVILFRLQIVQLYDGDSNPQVYCTPNH